MTWTHKRNRRYVGSGVRKQIQPVKLLVSGLVLLVLRLGGGRLVAGGGGRLVAGGGGRLVAGLGHRHLRGRVLGGHGRRQMVTIHLDAVGVGRVGDGVGDAVVTDVAVLALDLVAGVIAVAGHRLAGLGGGDAVLSLVAVENM